MPLVRYMYEINGRHPAHILQLHAASLSCRDRDTAKETSGTCGFWTPPHIPVHDISPYG